MRAYTALLSVMEVPLAGGACRRGQYSGSRPNSRLARLPRASHKGWLRHCVTLAQRRHACLAEAESSPTLTLFLRASARQARCPAANPPGRKECRRSCGRGRRGSQLPGCSRAAPPRSAPTESSTGWVPSRRRCPPRPARSARLQERRGQRWREVTEKRGLAAWEGWQAQTGWHRTLQGPQVHGSIWQGDSKAGQLAS